MKKTFINSEDIEDIFFTYRHKEMFEPAKPADIKLFMNSNPDQFAGTDCLQTLAKIHERKLNNLLQQEKTDKGDVENKIEDFYTSCLNVGEDDVKYRAALAESYKSIGKFSVFKTEEEKASSSFDWDSKIAKIQKKYGKCIILSLYILDDINDKSKTMPYIVPPEFEMTQGGVDIVEQEKRIRTFLHLYLDMTEEEAAITAKNIITFEKKLTCGATDVRNGKTVKEMLTLHNTTDLHKQFQYVFDVKEYLEIALGTEELPEQVYVYDESYLKGLTDVFYSAEQEQVDDYILWVFIEALNIDITSSDLSKECADK